MATIETNDAYAGPASYATGGIVITTGLASVDAFTIQCKTPGANLVSCRYEYARNTPGAGQVTVKIMRCMYDKADANLGDMSGLDGTISPRTSSGGTVDADAAHVHSMAHDHAAATSAAQAGAAGGNPTTALSGLEQSTHTHSFDPPNFTGNTGAGTSHDHIWNSIYQHQHSITSTETNMTLTELANGTDLSGATFFYRGVDE